MNDKKLNAAPVAPKSAKSAKSTKPAAPAKGKAAKGGKPAKAAPAPKTVVVEPVGVDSDVPKGFRLAAEGKVDGRPARVLVSRSAGVLDVQDENGDWHEHHSTAFGGKAAEANLVGHLDPAAPAPKDEPAQEEAPAAPEAKPAVAVEPAPEPEAAKDEVVAEVQAGAPVAPAGAPDGTADALASVRALTDLDAVRAALDAEARGQCRAAVVRALKVRAGEIVLGVDVASLQRQAPERKQARAVVASSPLAGAVRAVLAAHGMPEAGAATVEVPVVDFTEALGFPSTAREHGNWWRYDRPGVSIAASLGLSVEWDGRKKVVRFARAAAPVAEPA